MNLISQVVLKDNKEVINPLDFLNPDDFIDCKDYEYCCPKCKTEPPERCYKTRRYDYSVNFPVTLNMVFISNPNGFGWDWTELHICKKCGTRYKFENSSC